ncbi:AsmA-like C-terminal region-containing protein [Ancylobacter pratisalsi]|uniref:DUF3971 domain-containing protein n=1 Tax=Ancylobacter pratisalsi TaxID=1745854 RepID=A0A6P1YH39_9HYPH|nr:AsmA-like C-terminal region-containing protein [Ancylobacter pratisalsi]QIB32472.1 hypothetical protein G3A50_01230 [Ancylobacter pratisalsi]
MKQPTTRKADAGAKRVVRRPRLRRIAKACADAPVRKRRWLRVCGWSLGTLMGLAIASVVGVYLMFTTGLLTVDMARPYIESALEARLGGGRTVQIGEIVADRALDGGVLLKASNIVVRDAAGDVIAIAPQADVTMQDGLLPWVNRPRRIDLVGVKVTVRIDAQGGIAISTEGGKPIAAPAADVPPVVAPRQGAPSSTGDNAPTVTAADQLATPVGPLRLSSLAAFADAIDRGGLDGGDLSEVGLKDGILVVRSDISGRQWTFDDIDLSLSRPSQGGMSFDLTAGGTDGPWSASATIGALTEGQRPLTLKVRDLAPRDLMIAAGQADADLVATSPLSLDFSARIDNQGLLIASEGRLVAGAGEFQLGPDVAGRTLVDEASLTFKFDPVRHVLALTPLSIQAGPFGLELNAEIKGPLEADGKWQLRSTKARASFGGGGIYSEKEPPLILDDVAVLLSMDTAAHRISIDQAVFKGPQGGVTLSGALDIGSERPSLALSVSATPMSATSLKRLWPIVAAPDVRKWVYEHIVSGDVSRAEIAFDAPLDSIGNKQRPLAAEAVSINVVGSNGVLRPIPELPPLEGADLAVEATGRSAHVVASRASITTPGGRKLDLPEGVLDVPNVIMDNPPAKLQLTVSGPAAAAVELASRPPLRGAAAEQMNPDGVGGTINGTAQINIKLSEHIKPADVDYAFDANLTDFSADDVFLGQKLNSATVRAFVTPAATVLRGEGKVGGAPASFEYTRPSTGDATFTIAATLDDAARANLNLDLASISGTVGVKLSGKIGTKTRTADVDLDLTNARLAELVPGWSKPAGKPARLTADAVINNSGTQLDNLVITGQGVNIRGSVDLDAKSALVSANLPTFQLSDGDKASVKAENVDGVMKLTVRGEVIEARAFLKNLLEAPVAGARNEKPPDIDLDVNLGVVAGNNGETMRQAVLRMSRRGGTLTAFDLAAMVGRGGGVKGELTTQNGRPLLRVATSDAGALLRFVDLYSRIYGGDLWIDVDPPNGSGKPQSGVVNMRDFTIRGEPGLDRLIAAAPSQTKDGRPAPGAAVAFRKMQADFQRSAEQLNIRDGAIWGPSIGSTFDGTLDFAADRVAVRGTYVPAYGLNNLFSRVPVLGFFLGGGPNEGLVGVTYEVVGPLSGPTLRVNPISAVAPGFLRKIFEFRQAPDPTPPGLVPTR